jgi:hypothetical protein
MTKYMAMQLIFQLPENGETFEVLYTIHDLLCHSLPYEPCTMQSASSTVVNDIEVAYAWLNGEIP